MKTVKDPRKLKLGDEVRTAFRYERIKEGKFRFWGVSCEKSKGEFVKCIFLGLRTTYDGYVFSDSYFNQTKSKRVALVCANVNENPFYTPLWSLMEE